MFKLTLATFTLAAGAVTCPLALAQISSPAHAAMQTVQVSGPALRRLSEAEYQNVKGLYWMSDGRLLKLHRQGLRLWAEVDGEPSTEVRAVSPTHLASLDGRMSFRFGGDEHVSRVHLVIERPSR
jgi:hypothetical protein